MKKAKLFFLTLILFLTVSMSCSDPVEDTVLLVDKKVRIEFFTNRDLTGSTYDNYYVMIRAGAIKMTYDPYLEEVMLDETTDWIAFKDIPTGDAPIVFEADIPQVDNEKQTVVFGYSYVIKNGNHTELRAANNYVEKNKASETLRVEL